MLYYVARFVDSPDYEKRRRKEEVTSRAPWWAYIFDYLNEAMDTFDRSLLRLGIHTLERCWYRNTAVANLAGSAMYPFVATTIASRCIAWGAILFGFPLGVNWLSVVVVLLATLQRFRFGNFIGGAFAVVQARESTEADDSDCPVIGGMLPRDILPHWLQIIAGVNPVTYARMHGRALLDGASVWESVGHLVLVGFELNCSLVELSAGVRRSFRTLK
jgi:hypothetical protein